MIYAIELNHENKRYQYNRIIDGKAMKRVNQAALIFSLIFIFPCQSLFGLSRDEARDLSESINKGFTEAENQAGNFNVNGTIQDYLAFAALHNPGLKSAFYDWQSTLKKEGVVEALPDPMISYGYFIKNVETRVGPQEQKFGIRQTIPWFGTLGAKGDMAFEASNIAFQKYQKTKLELFYKVKSAYYDYWFLGREIELTRENMELLQFWESVARTKYKVAQQTHHDVIKAQVELGKLDDDLKTLESMVQPISARLSSVLNLPDSVLLPIPASITEDETAAVRDIIVEKVLSFNPDLKSIENLIEKEKADVRLANKSWFPDFTFGVDYIQTGPALNPTMAESGKDPLMVSFNVNIPIWWGKYKSKQDEARARYKSAQYSLNDTRNKLIESAEQLIFEYDDALRKIRLYRDGLVPEAEESLNATFAAYEAGNADFLNVLDAQRQLLDFQLMLDRSRRNQAVKKAALEVITGENLDGHVKQKE